MTFLNTDSGTKTRHLSAKDLGLNDGDPSFSVRDLGKAFVDLGLGARASEPNVLSLTLMNLRGRGTLAWAAVTGLV